MVTGISSQKKVIFDTLEVDVVSNATQNIELRDSPVYEDDLQATTELTKLLGPHNGAKQGRRVGQPISMLLRWFSSFRGSPLAGNDPSLIKWKCVSILNPPGR